MIPGRKCKIRYGYSRNGIFLGLAMEIDSTRCLNYPVGLIEVESKEHWSDKNETRIISVKLDEFWFENEEKTNERLTD